MGSGNGKASVKLTRWVFTGVLLAVCLLRVWYAVLLPLSGDEAYHWEWSRHPAWGYYDHPPMTAFVIKATTLLASPDSELGVRLGAILLLAGVSVILYLFSRRIASDSGGNAEDAERAGWMAGLLALMVPLFAGLGVYMSTDPAVVFFCSLSLYCVYMAATRGGWLRWMLAGFAIGCMMLSKFLGVFTLGGMMLFMLLSRDDRRWFSRPQPYIAALVALMVVAPFIAWNHANDWATFKFNLVTRQAENAFNLKHFPEFVLSQLFAVSPLVFVLGLAGLYRAFKMWRAEKGREVLYLLCTALVPLSYFVFTSLRRRVGLHWPACGWIPVMAIVPFLYARGKFSLLWMRLMLWSCIALTFIVHVAANIPSSALRKMESKFNGTENGGSVFEDERYGWREAGMWVEQARDWIVKDQGNKPRGVFLMSGQYGVSAALAFYMPGQPHVHLWSVRRTHGENYRFWDDYASLHLQDAVYFAKTEKKALEARPVLQKHFTYVGEPEKLTIEESGQYVRSFYLMKCFIFGQSTPDVTPEAGL